MKRLLLKLSDLKTRLAAEFGRFILFGLFKRQHAPGTWDLVVSAPWLRDERTDTRALFFERLREKLGPKDVLKLSRVVILSPSDGFLRTLDAVDVEDGALTVLGELTTYGTVDLADRWVDIRGCELNGMPLEHAVLFANHPEYRQELLARRRPPRQRATTLRRKAAGARPAPQNA